MLHNFKHHRVHLQNSTTDNTKRDVVELFHVMKCVISHDACIYEEFICKNTQLRFFIYIFKNHVFSLLSCFIVFYCVS